ncbi:MAG: hypothetical protein K6D54_08500 [Bacteroidales bacterium]|nr:hypothetical protein [Bacteroidales bacterium]
MKLNKIFKWGMVLLIVISVAIVVWGFVAGFNDGPTALPPTNALLTWAAILIGIAVFCWVVIGLIVSIANDPKSLVKIGLILLGAAVLCLVSYLLASGAPLLHYTGDPVSPSTLKLTDAILNLTYICGAAAILAIVVGEIRMAIVNKK